MHINANFAEKVVVRPDEYQWIKSPAAGVERMMLDRIGEEVARATTIVRFAPKSYFDAHTHGGGEEFLVLEGMFSDETGDYPAGTYVRNPIGTSHRPHTEAGCTILVKLHQFDPSDTRQFHVDINGVTYRATGQDGVEVLPLHEAVNETVEILRLAPGARSETPASAGGEEIFVLDGTLLDAAGAYPAGSWIRHPDGPGHAVWTETGARLYRKTGHLKDPVAA